MTRRNYIIAKTVFKKNIKYLKKQLKLFLQYTKYYFTYWKVFIKYNYGRLIIKPFLNDKIGTVVFFLILFYISFLINHFVANSVFSAISFTYFTTAGAMVGGILAILFTLNTFLMQNAAENSSAGLYKSLAKDQIQDLIYFLIALSSIILFSWAFITSENILKVNNIEISLLRVSFVLSLPLIGFVFWLVYLLYTRVFERIQPYTSIRIIEKESLDLVNDFYKRAMDSSIVIKSHPKAGRKYSKKVLLAISFNSLRGITDELNSKLNHLFDYHDKLLLKKEKNMALLTLNTLSNILRSYFKIKKDSSLILTSYEYFTPISDSQQLLQPHLERLNSLGEEYIRDNNDIGVRHVVHLYKDLALSASEIKYVDRHGTSNPVFEQCRGNLDQFIESIIQQKNMEGMFQAANVYGILGIVAIKKNFNIDIHSTFTMLNKIGQAGILQQHEVVVGEVLKSYTLIISYLIKSRYFNLEIELGALFDELKKLLILIYYGSTNGYLKGFFTTYVDFHRPFDAIEDHLRQIISEVESITSQEKIRELKEDFIIVVEEVRSNLRYLSEKLKTADHPVIHHYGDLICTIGLTLLDLTDNPKWRDKEKKLIEILGWYIHQPWWFINHAEKFKSNLNFDSLTHAVSKLGIFALTKNNFDIPIEAIDIIFDISTKDMNQKAQELSLYEEPRTMELACHIGILAFKLNKHSIVDHLKTKIKSFEEFYRSKWFSNYPQGRQIPDSDFNKLRYEVEYLANTIRRQRGLPIGLNRSDDLLFQYIEEADVNNFIAEVWSDDTSG